MIPKALRPDKSLMTASAVIQASVKATEASSLLSAVEQLTCYECGKKLNKLNAYVLILKNNAMLKSNICCENCLHIKNSIPKEVLYYDSYELYLKRSASGLIKQMIIEEEERRLKIGEDKKSA